MNLSQKTCSLKLIEVPTTDGEVDILCYYAVYLQHPGAEGFCIIRPLSDNWDSFSDLMYSTDWIYRYGTRCCNPEGL